MQSGACVRPLDALLGSLRDCLDRFPDKRYISREAFLKLWQRGLHLISGIRRNMRNPLMPLAEKLMLRKRFIIETVLNILKCGMELEHSRHRSVVNGMAHILSCL